MKIYVAGMGVAMGPLALIARDMGHEVVCSDKIEHDLTEYMRSLGFVVHIGQDGSSITQEHSKSAIDWFIHTSALKADHPEITFAKENGIRVSKRDEFINEFLEITGLKMIAVAGTHGKTNTTAMIAWALEQANIPISYSIGTRISFGEFGKYDPKSKYFIYEADEFDRNFLHFSPAISLITNISFDHPDTYADQLDYDEAFAQFIEKSSSVYIYADDFNGSGDRIHVFGKDENESSTDIAGLYIRQNARLVLEMLNAEFEIDYQQAAGYLNSFPGTSRRMEKIADNLYSDYAHHPDEIRATIQMAGELNKTIVVVYQPHQNIRQHEIMDSYTDSFEGASKIYWLPTYLSRERDDLDVLTPDQLVENLTNAELAVVSAMDDKLAESIKTHLSEGSLVVCMSAGDLDHWVRSNLGKN